MMQLEIPVMIAATVACVPIFYLGMVVTRFEGAMLFGAWVMFTIYLILEAIESPWAQPFGIVFVIFGLAAFIAVWVLSLLQFRRGRRASV
jgi:cation:H+ antiporter